MQHLALTSEFAFPALVEQLARLESVRDLSLDQAHGSLFFRFSSDGLATVSNAIADFLLGPWLIDVVLHERRSDFVDCDDDQLRVSVDCVFQTWRHGDILIDGHPYSAWHARIRRSIKHILCVNQRLSVDGFGRFRLRSPLFEMGALVEFEVKKRARESEFERAVTGLRSILATQPDHDEELHVFCTREGIWIADLKGVVIDDPSVSDAIADANDDLTDVDQEDAAMTTLITRSPRRIVIHDLNPDATWPSFVETVYRLFEGRARICEQCPTCGSWEQIENRFGVRWRRGHREKGHR